LHKNAKAEEGEEEEEDEEFEQDGGRHMCG
jgi:hypothetical protein